MNDIPSKLLFVQQLLLELASYQENSAMNDPENVELTQGGQKKLGSLLDLRNLPLAEAIRQRGGGQSK